MPYQERPQELLAPHSGLGGGGLLPADRLPTSEGFEGIPFYGILTESLLIGASPSSTIIDVGTGTATVIRKLIKLDKVRHPFHILGVDINEVDLEKARSWLASLPNLAVGDSMSFLRRSANDLRGIAEDNSVDLITALNSIHLYDDPRGFFADAWRLLRTGAELFVNTAYATDIMFPDPVADRRAWGNIVVGARSALRKLGFAQIPKPNEPPNQLTSNQYEALAKEAGFKVETDICRVEIPVDQARALVAVEEFARGIIPIPNLSLDLLQKVLMEAVGTPLNRNWLNMRAIKPAPSY